jgi:anion-transporting  ArsA/GET3 family ATPase
MATQKVHLFTGKGGVGKSAVAAAFALNLCRRYPQHSILLSELAERSFYKEFFELERATYKPQLAPGLAENLSICQWSPSECLKEYALHLLKVESLYRLFFENPVSRSLIQVAPGLQELSILGKATSSVRNHGPPLNADQIVIDSYATGHFINLFNAPAALAEVISIGPMGEQSKSIDKWIRNPSFCNIHIVTLPELFPTTETLELFHTCVKSFGLTPMIYINKYLPFTSEDLVELNPAARSYLQEQLEAQEAVKATFRAEGISFIPIPWIPELSTRPLIDKIQEAMHEALHG